MDRPVMTVDDYYTQPYDDAFLMGWNCASDQLRGFYSHGTDNYLVSVRAQYGIDFLKGFYAALGFCLDVSYTVATARAPRGYCAFTCTYKRALLDHPRT